MEAIERAENAYQFQPQEAVDRHHDALATAWSKHSAMLYRIALRKLRNPEDAEDALQDALLSAYKNMDQFRGAAQLSTWLGSIVLNSARMQMRRRFNRDAVSIDAACEVGEPIWSERLVDSQPNPEELASQAENREALDKLVEQLPARIRTAFRLRVFDGLSTEEAAVALGVPIGTLKARVFRACRKVAALTRKAISSHQTGKRGSQERSPARTRASHAALTASGARQISASSKFARVAEVCSESSDETAQLQEFCV